jgi:signal transduction histidine kinase
VEATAAWQRQTRAVVVIIASGLCTLMLVDVVLGVQLFDVVWPAFVADVAVLGACAVALTDADRRLVAASLFASTASVVVSLAVEFANPRVWSMGVGLGAWPGFAELAGLGLLAGWSVRVARPSAALASAVTFAAALVAIVVWRTDGYYSEHLMLASAGAWTAVVAAGWYLRTVDNQQRVDANRARQQERLAIARELHDVVAHHVTGIVVQAQAALLVADRQPTAAPRALRTIERAAGEALAAMRAMVGALREVPASGELEPAATIDDLRELGAANSQGQLAVRVDIDEEATSLPASVVASVHRIAREAVTNARRHANGATAVDINVSCGEGVVHLQVVNDGVLASRASGGFGLRGMAERAAAMGGEFHAGPRPQGGWEVTADLPAPVGASESS